MSKPLSAVTIVAVPQICPPSISRSRKVKARRDRRSSRVSRIACPTDGAPGWIPCPVDVRSIERSVLIAGMARRACKPPAAAIAPARTDRASSAERAAGDRDTVLSIPELKRDCAASAAGAIMRATAVWRTSRIVGMGIGMPADRSARKPRGTRPTAGGAGHDSGGADRTHHPVAIVVASLHPRAVAEHQHIESLAGLLDVSYGVPVHDGGPVHPHEP